MSMTTQNSIPGAARGNKRAQGQGNIGLDAPEMQETISPAPGTEEDSETFSPPRSLGFGGNLASIKPGSIRKE
jgi:hypothetical protein